MAKEEIKVNSPEFRAKIFALAELIRDEGDVLTRTYYFGQLSKLVWKLIFANQSLEKELEELKVQYKKLI